MLGSGGYTEKPPGANSNEDCRDGVRERMQVVRFQGYSIYRVCMGGGAASIKY